MSFKYNNILLITIIIIILLFIYCIIIAKTFDFSNQELNTVSSSKYNLNKELFAILPSVDKNKMSDITGYVIFT
jgi:hypothetical protein